MKCRKIIDNFYNKIYPDEEVRNYMWNNNSLTINGEKKFNQLIFIQAVDVMLKLLLLIC